MQFHLLSFEGPDPYARAGGIATRVEGLARALADLGLETHLWFIGDPDLPGLLAALSAVSDIDVVSLHSPVAPCCRRVLLRGSDAVLANSGHEPFGLVGLETMAAGGIACTGATGEEYALPSYNALVLEAGTPHEFATAFQRLRSHPREAVAMRGAARSTALRYAWPRIVERVLLPRLEALEGWPQRDSWQS
ncbi:MAG: glycosyltransferase family 1 protein [Myxococcales bacterium]|nr:MAG: glycosyltransferase family 1 protein [Myxococcales bacterium]